MSEFPVKCLLLQCCIGEACDITCEHLSIASLQFNLSNCLSTVLTGLSMALKITQTPIDLFLVIGASMNITCRHNDKSYDKIFWYQQTKGQSLEHLGLISFKQPLVDRKGFTITGDAEKEANLLVSSVKAEHSAVYLCAVSDAQCFKFIRDCTQKPLPPSHDTRAPGLTAQSNEVNNSLGLKIRDSCTLMTADETYI